MALAGELEIRIFAELARLRADMQAATGVVETHTRKIDAAVDQTKRGLEALGITLSVAAFAAIIRGSIDAMDHLNDLSKSTGLLVEQLAGLQIAAKMSGTDLDSLAGALNKLSVNIGKNGEKFRELGITATDPLEAFKQLSDIFNQTQDQSLKAALGAATLGKQWASAAPLLAEGSRKIGEMVEQGSKLSGITKAMAEQADAFNDKMVLLTGTHGLMHREVGALLPLLNTLLDDLFDLKGKSEGADEGFHVLLETFRAIVVLAGNVAFTIRGVGTEIGVLLAQTAALNNAAESLRNFDRAGVTQAMREFSTIGKEATADAENARTKFDAWEKKILSLGTSTQEAAKKVAAMSAADTEAALANEQVARAQAAATEKKVRAFVAEKKAVEDLLGPYRSLLKALQDKTLAEHDDTEVNRTIIAIEAMSEKQKAALTLAMRLQLLELANSVDQKKADKAALDQLVKTEEDWLGVLKEINDAVAKNADTITQGILATEKEIEQIQFETSLIGKDVAERERMEAIRALTLKGITAETQGYDELLRRLIAANAERRNGATADAWQKQLDQMQFELSLIALTSAERDKAIRLRQLETSGIDTESEAYARLRQGISDAMDQAARQSQLMQVWQGIDSAFKQAFESILTGGKDTFQQLRDALKKTFIDYLYEQTLKKWVFQLFTSVTGLGGAGAALAGTGGLGGASSGILDWVLGRSSGAGAGFGMNDRSLGDNTMPGLFEKYLGDSAPLLKGLGQVAGGIALGLGAGGAIARAIGGDDVHPLHSIIGTIVGSVIGYIYGDAYMGGAIGGAAGGILDGILNEGLAQRTATVGYGNNRDYTYSGGSAFGQMGIIRGSDEWFSDADMGQTLRSWFNAISKLDTEVAKHFSAAEVERATALLGQQSPIRMGFGEEHSNLSPELLGQMIQQRYGVIFSSIDQAMGDLIANFKGSNEELLTLVVDLATVHERLTGLHASLTTVFGQEIGFSDIQKLKGDTEGYTEALQRLASEYTVTNRIAEMLGKTQADVWGSIGLASEGARAHLIELAGGLESLDKSLTYYYEHFYTTQEQQAHTLHTLQQAFSDVGVAMPTTVDGFRAITDHFLGMGEAGAQAAAQMLALAPAFYQYIQAIEAVDAAIKKSGDGMASIFGQAITVDDVRTFQGNGEELTATLARISSEFTSTNQLLALFGMNSQQVFGAFGLASEAARAKLIELSGGLDAFTTNLAGFYNNYFTAEERQALSMQSMQAQFTAWGLQMPTTVQGFRDLVQQQLALGPAGASVVAGLLAMQQAFFDTHQTANEATTAINGAAAALHGFASGKNGQTPLAAGTPFDTALKTQADLEKQLYDATHNANEVLAHSRELEMERLRLQEAEAGMLPGTLTALQELINAREDEVAAAKRAAQTVLDFGAAMDKLHGNNAYSQFFAQYQAASSLSAVTAAMPWITSLNQLMTMSIDDFGQYSDANKQLILAALNAAGALQDLTQSGAAAVAVFQNYVQQTPNTATGYWNGNQWVDTTGGAGGGDTDASAAAKLLSDRLELLAKIAELTGDRVGAAAILEQQRAIVLQNLDPTLVDLTKTLWGLQDAAKQATETKELADKYFDLNQQYLRATGQDALATALERAKVIASLPTQLLKDMQQQVYDALDAAALKQKLDAWTGSLQGWLDSIKLDSSLSPLLPKQRLDAAQQRYVDDLMKAQAGDEAARGRFTEDMNAYLREALGVFGRASPEYLSIFNALQAQAQQMVDANNAAGQQTVQNVIREAQTAAREDARGVMERMESMQAEIAALRRDREAEDSDQKQRDEKMRSTVEAGANKVVDAIQQNGPKGNMA